TVIARDGSQIFCEASFSHIGEKKEIALQGIIRNVTERKKHENELLKAKQIAEENEERFKALHNASFGGISIHDKGVILECNQGLSEMTGYSIDELIGMDGLLLIAPESRNMVIKNMMKAYEKPYEAFGLRKNGEIFPLQLEARNIPYKGKTVRTVEFRDITERKQIENEIHQTNAQLKRLAGHLQNIREEERLVISRELHDNLGQSLTAMRMELFYLKEQINSSEISKDKAQLLDDYENMIESFDAIVKSVREISRNIRPSIIEDFGLIPAIEWLITEFEQRYKIDCDVSIKRGLTIELEKKNLIGIYRIAQESLTNIVKHANATKVHVSLDQTKEKYCMKISDNGTGFDFKTSKNKKTLGLIGMKERAFMFNGKINITGTPGKGTVVEVIIPVKQRKNTSL
ncbi:MAG: PAS domain-containing sensor histidine kinase, partial [Bacteroidota bacterium]